VLCAVLQSGFLAVEQSLAWWRESSELMAGTFGGAKTRGLLAKMFGRDLPAALLEDAVAVGIAAFALFR